VDGHRSALLVRVEGDRLAEPDRAAGDQIGPFAREDGPGVGRLLEACGEVDGVAREELPAGGALARHEHLAGLDADPHRQGDAVPRLEIVVERLEALEHLQGGPEGALPGGRTDGGDAEDRHDRVPDVALQRPAPGGDDLRHRLDVGAQQRTQPLGVQPLAGRGRGADAGQQDGGELPLLTELDALRGGRRRRLRVQRRVLVQDLPLELLERRAGVDAELLHEGPPRGLGARPQDAFPDFGIELTAGFVAGDRAAMEWVMSGTHERGLPGMPATGRRFRVRGATMLELRDGRVTRNRDYWDTATLLTQMGLTP